MKDYRNESVKRHWIIRMIESASTILCLSVFLCATVLNIPRGEFQHGASPQSAYTPSDAVSRGNFTCLVAKPRRKGGNGERRAR